MAIQTGSNSLVVTGAQTVGLSQTLSTIVGSARPAYLVLTALDRNEYAAAATGTTGSFSGNGNTAQFGFDGGDGRAVSIVFTYDASTGLYYNDTYGYLNQLQYAASESIGDVTNISLFDTNNPFLAQFYAYDAFILAQADPSGYLGSITIVTEPGFAAPATLQATPDSIAATAESFVGRAWNMDGCWVLASTIAAEAGASLPIQSTMLARPGQANGEWIVAFNGPAGQSGNWQSLVKAGEMVVFMNPGGASGHITTCVSGSGATAMLVDNITYENIFGQVTNPAKDGSSSDIVIAPPHPATQEWTGVAGSSVVIYELDTPIVAATTARISLTAASSQTLAALFSATDPANKAITGYQAYDTWKGDSLAVGGIACSAHSAASAVSASSLASLSLVAGSSAGSDTLEVRAFNGTYWGDWTALNVTVVSASPPTLTHQTPNQVWQAGQSISLNLAPNTFTDPQSERFTYAATQMNGQALPSWLRFNTTSDSFSGTAPITPLTLGIRVTATDSSGLSSSEAFVASVDLPPPALANQTPDQVWKDGTSLSFTLPSNTFAAASGQDSHLAAYEISGPDVSDWLYFNDNTRTFSGKIPQTIAGRVLIEVSASTNSGSATETFGVSFASGAGSVASGVRPAAGAEFIALHS